MHPKQMQRMMRRPVDLMRFQATGKLPAMFKPKSPLIDLLVAIGPRACAGIRNLVVDETLGYTGSRTFATAQNALNWIRPSEKMVEGENFPADSWRDKRFNRTLYLDDLLGKCTQIPADVLSRNPRLRRPAPVEPILADDQTPGETQAPRPRG